MWETFLLQMNDFDRFLEFRLRHMLDPVVATRPPVRRGRHKRSQEPILTVGVELATAAIPVVVEPMTVAVAPARTL